MNKTHIIYLYNNSNLEIKMPENGNMTALEKIYSEVSECKKRNIFWRINGYLINPDSIICIKEKVVY